MPDPYSDLAHADTEKPERIAQALAAWCVDPAQVALRQAYLGGVKPPSGPRAVEVGGETGRATGDLVKMAGAATAHGTEPSGVMVEHERPIHTSPSELSFAIGNAKAASEARKVEARKRMRRQTFVGFMSYVCVNARKPGDNS